jgi:hypothetical protein
LFAVSLSLFFFQLFTPRQNRYRNGADWDPPVLTNYPADYDNVLSVAAVDEDKNWAVFRYASSLLLLLLLLRIPCLSFVNRLNFLSLSSC